VNDWEKTQAELLKLAVQIASLAGQPKVMPDPFPYPPALEPQAAAWLERWAADQKTPPPEDYLLRRLILARVWYAAGACTYYKRAGVRLPVSLATPENLVLLANELWNAGGRVKFQEAASGGGTPQN
jgi:hypothetical protein